MKTAISIPDSLFRAADRAAKHFGISRSRLYQRAVERYLSEISQQVVTDKLNTIFENECEPSLDSVLERMQSLSLLKEDW